MANSGEEEEAIRAEVVVIGGGISGLSAAYELSKRSRLRYIILEASDQPGGRTRSAVIKGADEEDVWDVGAQWVGRTQYHIMDLLAELNIGVCKMYHEGIKKVQVGSNKIRTYSSSIPNLSLLAMLDLYAVMKRTQHLIDEIDVHDPYSHPLAEQWDSMSVAQFNRQNIWTKEAMECLVAAIRCMFGKDPDQISLLYYLMYFKAAGGLSVLVETNDFSAQGYLIEGGTSALVSRLVSCLQSGKDSIKFKSCVTRIVQDENGVTVFTDTEGKTITYQCSLCIMAIPLHQIGFIVFDPKLPVAKTEMIKYMQPGNLIKIIITYKKAFWKEDKLSGEAVTNGGPSTEKRFKKGPLCIIYDASTPKVPALLAFVGGSQATQWRQVEEEKFKNAVMTSLVDIFGPCAGDYVNYKKMDWTQESFIRGCPTNSATPGSMRHFRDGVRAPFERIIFAGTETATEFCGYMSGAVQAGQRAALEVLYNTQPELLSQAEISHTFYGSQPKASKHTKELKSWLWPMVLLVGLTTACTVGTRLLKRY